jgi:hypothetical protein
MEGEIEGDREFDGVDGGVQKASGIKGNERIHVMQQIVMMRSQVWSMQSASQRMNRSGHELTLSKTF